MNSAKKKSKKENNKSESKDEYRYARICPKCKSLNIKLRWQSLWFIGLPPSFQCTHCKYTSNFFPEVKLKWKKKKLKTGKKQEKKQPRF